MIVVIKLQKATTETHKLVLECKHAGFDGSVFSINSKPIRHVVDELGFNDDRILDSYVIKNSTLVVISDSLEDEDDELILKPIRETGGSRTGSLSVSYSEIVDKIFPPNVTDMDDGDKVKASWGIIDNQGRKAFIWAYRFYGDIAYCDSFSVDGDLDVLIEVFGSSSIS